MKEFKTQIQYEIALRNLNENAWSKMNILEKTEAMQYIENYRAMISDREPCNVVVEILEKGIYGEFRPDTKEIILSKSELDKDFQESINTTLHEGAHATQKNLLETLDLEKATEEEIANIVSLNMPLSTNAAFQEYWNSPAELQAREFASQYEEQIGVEQQTIYEVDQFTGEDGIQTQNQILQTYDDYSTLELDNSNIDTLNEENVDISYNLDEENI